MNPAQFNRLEALFEDAIERPVAERAARVAELCAGDEALRDRLLRMVANAERPLVCDELETAQRASAPGQGPGTSGHHLGDLRGRTIGAYTVEELLGEGGFGSVYRARQHAPVQRPVALKVIKLGMDTAQVLARFDIERQALALMDHPHVAKVFDAGVTDAGRPFVVMELVEGEPINRFCDRRRLVVEDRLRLFIQVCRAVQHAHGKGVIHRDLKPTNILVGQHDGACSPKIIDFGIAKALDGRLGERSVLTELWQLVGTPEYMSPEQAAGAGGAVDTRSDVYALGVVLYELLVGLTPFEVFPAGASPQLDQVMRRVQHEEPARPSARLADLGSRIDEVAGARRVDPSGLRRSIRGDLDWIVLKAIARDPIRRYQTTAELAHDLERFLSHRAVEARPPSKLYLAGRFVRRHRVAVTAAAAVAVAAILGAAAALVGWRQAVQAREGQAAALEQARDHLWESLLAQARSARSGQEIGRRAQALAALSKAADLRRDEALRDEAIACLILPDFELEGHVAAPPNASAAGLAVVDRFAVPMPGGEILIRSIEDGRVLERLQSTEQACWVLRFSPDGRWLGGKFHDRSDDARMLFWRLGHQAPCLELTGERGQGSFVLGEVDGTPVIVLAGPDRRIELLGLPDGELLATLTLEHRPFRADLSPQGDRVLVSDFDRPGVSIWSIAENRLLLHIEPPSFVGPVAWIPARTGAAGGDDQELGERILGCGQDQRVHIWRADNGAPVSVLVGHQGAVADVGIDPSGALAATAGWDGTTRLWDLDHGTALVSPLVNARLAGLGDRLVVGEGDGLSIWRRPPATTFRAIDWPSDPGAGTVLTLSSTGRLLATAGERGIVVWDVKAGRQLCVPTTSSAVHVRFLDAGMTLIGATSEGIQQWRLDADGTRCSSPRTLLERTGIFAAEVDRDGRRLVIHAQGAIEVFDLKSEAPYAVEAASLPGYPGLAGGPSLDPTGRWLFTTNWRGEPARVWDLESRSEVHRVVAPNVRGAFSPSGAVLATTKGPAIEFWEVGSWRLLRSRPRDHSGELAGIVAFSGDGEVAAVLDSRHEVHLVEVATGRTLARLRAPAPTVIARLAFSEDGSTLAASTTIDQIHIWDVARIREELRRMGVEERR